MIVKSEILKYKKFILGIILPSLIAIGLFIISIFIIIIPNFERALMERKKEMIRELTNSAWSILSEFEKEEKQGLLSREEAQNKAIIRIQYMRYGSEGKDYFWITDMYPNMIIHPYRTDLNGKDLSDFIDPHGKKLFVEFANVVKKKGSGYVDYMWQWKDDSSRIVPKLSYVRGFEPWNWIIGTGIYIEDVKLEIERMTARLINISIYITLVIFFLLLFITAQSLKIEKKRSQAEAELIESREKYKSLVEASTEGTAMLMDGKYIYANKIMLEMLGYNEDEFFAIDPLEIFPEKTAAEDSSIENFKNLLNGEQFPSQFEAKIKRKNGELINALVAASKVLFMGHITYIIMVKDISSHKKKEEELGESEEKYKFLTDNINIGVFRTDVKNKYSFIDANSTAIKILGIKDKEQLQSKQLFQFINDEEDKHVILNTLDSEGFIKNKIIRFNKEDSSTIMVSLSLTLFRDTNNMPRFCDGIIEDITEQKKLQEKREILISELQTSLMFLNEPIMHSVKNIVSVDMNTSMRKAAGIMSKNNSSAILVTSENSKEVIGIVTDHDIRERLIAANIDLNLPLYKIMTSPVVSISSHAFIYEAILLMNEKGIRHLAVNDEKGNTLGIIRDRDILHLQVYSPVYLTSVIKNSKNIDEIIERKSNLPMLVKSMIDTGAQPKNISRVIAGISDLILNKCIDFASEELGKPPVKFVFMAFGSQGREEQTLVTDQDNAILFEDTDKEAEKSIHEYFIKFGEKICGWLDQAGYTFCKGDVMAKNPKWCQPLSQWKKYFTNWITTAYPQDFLEFNVFFDFRGIWGEKKFIDELRIHVNQLIQDKPSFLLLFAQNSLLYKPPIGILGNIVMESSGENPGKFNIKDAMMPIVNFARIYALKNNITETNTIDRINKLYDENHLKKSTHDDILITYNYLMQLRMKHQALSVSENVKPDNFINPKKLSHIEETMLKQAFSQISIIQKKISFDFMGSA